MRFLVKDIVKLGKLCNYDVGMQCFGYTLVHLSLSGYFIEAQKKNTFLWSRV